MSFSFSTAPAAPRWTLTPLIVDPTLWHVSNAPNTYYFSVVDINGSQVTVNSYSGNTGDYAVFDSFDLFRMIYLPLILKR